MTVGIFIQAHEHGAPVLKLTLPYWESLGYPVTILCPWGQYIPSRHQVIACGPAGHSGGTAGERNRIQWAAISQFRPDWCIITEYDTIVTRDGFDYSSPGLHGIVMPNRDGSHGFGAETYPLPPILVDRGSLIKICKWAEPQPRSIEHGFSDRWVGLAAKKLGIPLYDHQPVGYGQNTITMRDYRGVMEARARHGFAFHGVKSAETLAWLT